MNLENLSFNVRRIPAGLRFAIAHPNPYGLRIPAKRYANNKLIEPSLPKLFNGGAYTKRYAQGIPRHLCVGQTLRQAL